MKKLVSDVPFELLDGKPKDVQWMYNQQSIQRQQNEFISQQNETILTRLAENNDRLTAHEKEDLKALADLSGRIEVYDKLREKFSGAKVVVWLLFCGIGGPVFLAFVGALFVRAWEKWWK